MQIPSFMVVVILSWLLLCLPATAKDFFLDPSSQSIQDTILEVRDWKQTTPTQEPITVWLSPGTYDVSTPLVFQQQDSGTEEFPITYSSTPAGGVNLIGGTTTLDITNASWITFSGIEMSEMSDVAIIVEGASNNLVFDSLHIHHGLNNAISIRSGSSKHLVKNCDIHDMGRSGVWVTAGDRTSLQHGDVVLDNNEIYNIGLSQVDATAIGINGVGALVKNNHLHHLPHFAIQLDGNDHIVELNEINNSNMSTTDSGSIYMGRSWIDRGNIIRYNYIHDVQPLVGGAVMGIYLDDQESGFLIYGNVIERVYRGIMLGGGSRNTIANNIFIDTGFGGPGHGARIYADGRGVGYHFNNQVQFEELVTTPYTKAPWSIQYPELLTLLCDDPMEPKHNIIMNNVFSGSGDVTTTLGAQGKIEFKNNVYALFSIDTEYQVSFEGHQERITWEQIPFTDIGRKELGGTLVMSEIANRTFVDALIGANGFSSISEAAATINRISGGLNGTTGGVEVVRTANSPNTYGNLTGIPFAGLSAIRLSFYMDSSGLSMGANGNSAILAYFRDSSGNARLGSLRVTQVDGQQVLRAQLLPDTDVTVDIDMPPAAQPDWVEFEVIRESTDGAADGVMRVYFGGRDYATAGELVAEFLSVENYNDFQAVDRIRFGIQAGSALVTGNFKVDEIRVQNTNTPVLVGVRMARVNRIYGSGWYRAYSIEAES